MAASCPITASSQACLQHCDRAGRSFVAILRTRKTGRLKGLGMKTSPCLHFCLVYGEPHQPYGLTHIPPGVPTITQPCRIHARLFPGIPVLLVPSPALRADGKEEDITGTSAEAHQHCTPVFPENMRPPQQAQSLCHPPGGRLLTPGMLRVLT